MKSFIRPYYFWDINIENLDMKKSRKLIIERVFSLGSLDDVKELISFYGKDVVLNTLLKLNYLDDKTLNFASLLFQTSKNNFTCYKRKQSTSQPWN